MWITGLSCSVTCGIFQDQGPNLCLLHWQADSLPSSHQGKPGVFFTWGTLEQCLEMLVATDEGMLLASRGWRPGLLLPSYTAQDIPTAVKHPDVSSSGLSSPPDMEEPDSFPKIKYELCEKANRISPQGTVELLCGRSRFPLSSGQIDASEHSPSRGLLNKAQGSPFLETG